MITVALGIFFAVVFGMGAINSAIRIVGSGSFDLMPSLMSMTISILISYFTWVRIKNIRKLAKLEKDKKQQLFRKEDQRKELLNGSSNKELQVKYLGGAGYKLTPEELYYFGVMDSKIRFISAANEVLDVEFADIISYEVGGVGTTTTNAGVTGGGFGIEGFIKGAVTAAVINAATTKSSTNTFLKMTSKKGELFLHTAMCEPAELRMILSPLSIKIANRINEVASVSVADELSKLNDLVKSGVITDSDFSNAKNKLLG